MEKIELSVKAQLGELLSNLEDMSKKARQIQDEIGKTGHDVEKEIQKSTKQTGGFLKGVKRLGGEVASQLKKDFKTLMSINALKESLKISEQFRGAISESVSLSDNIRRLGATFNIAKGDFSSFQSFLTKGLGDIGLGADVASRAITGLANTSVRDQGAVLEYSKAAGQLASISGSQGQEGEIAAGISRVIVARGGDANDVGAMKQVAEDLRRVFKTTGKSPQETLQSMESIFATMSTDMRKQVSTRQIAELAAIGQVAGPGATSFLEEFMGQSAIQRQAFEAQGFKGVVGPDGIDLDKFQEAAQGILDRVGGDPRLAAKTLGLSDQAAEGFVRLTESMDRVREAQKKIIESTGSLNEQYLQSRGLGESFRANINRVKSAVSEPLAATIEGITSGLSKTAESDVGATATVLGGGALAALMAGFGMRGIGSVLKGAVTEQAYEGITGEEVQKVFVVNADQIGGGGVMGTVAKGGKMAAMAGLALKGLAVGGAGYAGYKLGEVANEKLVDKTQGTTAEGFEGNIIERLFFKIDKLIGGEGAQNIQKAQETLKMQKIVVESRDPKLKVVQNPRGQNI